MRLNPKCTTEGDEADFRRWLAWMQYGYQIQLVGWQEYPISFWRNDELLGIDKVQVYEFVPCQSCGAGGIAERTGTLLR